MKTVCVCVSSQGTMLGSLTTVEASPCFLNAGAFFFKSSSTIIVSTRLLLIFASEEDVLTTASGCRDLLGAMAASGATKRDCYIVSNSKTEQRHRCNKNHT